MRDDWVYDADGNKYKINNRDVDAYFNSDKGGKEHKTALLFGYVKLLTAQLNQNTIDIQNLKNKISELESGK